MSVSGEKPTFLRTLMFICFQTIFAIAFYVSRAKSPSKFYYGFLQDLFFHYYISQINPSQAHKVF